MRKRVEETLDLLGLADLRHRPLHELSGGQQQRVAIGSVLTAHPRSWCWTSRPPRWTRPRPRRCWPRSPGWCTTSASPSCWPSTGSNGSCSTPTGSSTCPATARSTTGEPAPMFARTTRRAAGGRAGPAGRLDAAAAVGARRPPAGRDRCGDRLGGTRFRRVRAEPTVLHAATGAAARKMCVRYGDGDRGARRRPDLAAGEVTALMGRNGSGKSSLLWALQGSGPRHGGQCRRGRRRSRAASAAAAPAHWSAWCRRPRPTCSTWTRWAPNSPRPTGSPAPAPAPRAHAARPAGARHRRRPPSARPVRGPAAGAGAGHPAARRRRGRAAGRADPRPGLPGQARAEPRSSTTLAGGRPRDRGLAPTTSSSSPRPPTGWSCWPTGEIVADGADRRGRSSPRRPSRRRSPRSWRRCRTSRWTRSRETLRSKSGRWPCRRGSVGMTGIAVALELAAHGRDPTAARTIVDRGLASFIGLVAFLWPFVVAPGPVRRHATRRR